MLFRFDHSAGLVSAMALVPATQNWPGKAGSDTLMNYEEPGVCAWLPSLGKVMACAQWRR